MALFGDAIANLFNCDSSLTKGRVKHYTPAHNALGYGKEN